jgi:hypothetical protein
MEESGNKEATELRVSSGYTAVATSKALRSPWWRGLPFRNSCHQWPRICSGLGNHNSSISSFMNNTGSVSRATLQRIVPLLHQARESMVQCTFLSIQNMLSRLCSELKCCDMPLPANITLHPITSSQNLDEHWKRSGSSMRAWDPGLWHLSARLRTQNWNLRRQFIRGLDTYVPVRGMMTYIRKKPVSLHLPIFSTRRVFVF